MPGCRTNFRIVSLSALSAAMVLLAAAQNASAGDCPSKLTKAHQLNGVAFETSSRVYRDANVEVYESCVKNTGDKDLWIDWKIPGPKSYVLPGEAVPSARTFVTRQTIDAHSCLEYGPLSEMLVDPYLGHAADSAQMQSQDSQGCRPVPTSIGDKILEKIPDYIETLFKLFVPSDREKSHDTMLKVEGKTSTRVDGEGAYRQSIVYMVSRIEGRSDGNPQDLTIRLESESPAAAYLRAASSFKDMSWKITNPEENEIGFTVAMPKNPTLENARYEILDRNKLVVGSFFAPAWIETPQ
ncbi:MAG: hypothetical protein E6Q76_19745 [Rhizobium sp.]|nr:MAG: hypothetical protein E6Q76_19745 [Rhizobium sp.]